MSLLIPAVPRRSAMSFAPIDTLGLSFLSCLAQPKYGITATIDFADALFAASIMSSSSIRLSELGNVDCTRNT